MDDLLEYVLDQISFNGPQGCSSARLWRIVEDFWAKNGQMQNVDDLYKRFVWKMFMRCDDFVIGVLSDQPDIQKNKKNSKGIDAGLKSKYVRIEQKTGQTLEELQLQYQDDLVLCTAEDCQWRALTGNKTSSQEVQNLALACLTAIARSREQGITLMDLYTETGQDKRSAPKRCKDLQEKGLIHGFPVLAPGANTTMYVHYRFLEDNNSHRERQEALGDQSRMFDLHIARRDLSQLLTNSTNKILTLKDCATLLKKSSVLTDMWTQKRFQGQIEFMSQAGYIKKVRVPGKDAGSLIPCVQLLKEYVENDSSIPRKACRLAIQVEENTNMLDGGADLPNIQRPEGLGADSDTACTIDHINEPSLCRNVPLELQIQQCIARYGPTGIAGPKLSQEIFGRHWSRPFDELMKRLTSLCSVTTQPQLYSNLALAPACHDATSKLTQFRYYTQEFGLSPVQSHKSIVLEGRFPRLKTSEISSIIPPKPLGLAAPKKRGRPRLSEAVDRKRASISIGLECPDNPVRTAGPVCRAGSHGLQTSIEGLPEMIMFPAKRGRPRKKLKLTVEGSTIREVSLKGKGTAAAGGSQGAEKEVTIMKKTSANRGRSRRTPRLPDGVLADITQCDQDNHATKSFEAHEAMASDAVVETGASPKSRDSTADEQAADPLNQQSNGCNQFIEQRSRAADTHIIDDHIYSTSQLGSVAVMGETQTDTILSSCVDPALQESDIDPKSGLPRDTSIKSPHGIPRSISRENIYNHKVEKRKELLLQLIEQQGGLALLNSEFIDHYDRTFWSSTGNWQHADRRTLFKTLQDLEADRKIHRVEYHFMTHTQRAVRKDVYVLSTITPEDPRVKSFLEHLKLEDSRRKVSAAPRKVEVIPRPEMDIIPTATQYNRNVSSLEPLQLSAEELQLLRVRLAEKASKDDPSTPDAWYLGRQRLLAKQDSVVSRENENDKRNRGQSGARPQRKRITRRRQSRPEQPIHDLRSPFRQASATVEQIEDGIGSGNCTTQPKDVMFTEDQDETMFRAATLTSFFFSSAHETKIDWRVVASVVPGHDEVTLKRRYGSLLWLPRFQIMQELICSIDFANLYNDAVRSAKLEAVPRKLDKGGLVAFQIRPYIDLAKSFELERQSMLTADESEVRPIPQTIADFYAKHNITRISKKSNSTWQDNYFSAVSSTIKFSILSRNAFVMADKERLSRTSSSSEQIIAAIKSLLLTPEDRYDAKKGQDFLLRFGSEEQIEEAIGHLKDYGLISTSRTEHNRGPGRNIQLTEKYMRGLNGPISRETLSIASKYDRDLQPALQNNPQLPVGQLADDGTTAAVLELTLRGNVALHQGPKNWSPKGLTEAYKVRDIDPTILDFDLSLSRGQRPWLTDLVTQTVNAISGPCMWNDINGDPVESVYQRVVALVLGNIITRGQLGSEELLRLCSPVLTRHELDICLQNLVQKRCLIDTRGLYGVSDHYYHILK